MSPTELSIVVPVKDEEAAIDPFLDRVIPLLEGFDDDAARSFEILFVDDGSSDTTLEVVRKAHAADPRVRRAVRLQCRRVGFAYAAFTATGLERSPPDFGDHEDMAWRLRRNSNAGSGRHCNPIAP